MARGTAKTEISKLQNGTTFWTVEIAQIPSKTGKFWRGKNRTKYFGFYSMLLLGATPNEDVREDSLRRLIS